MKNHLQLVSQVQGIFLIYSLFISCADDTCIQYVANGNRITFHTYFPEFLFPEYSPCFCSMLQANSNSNDHWVYLGACEINQVLFACSQLARYDGNNGLSDALG